MTTTNDEPDMNDHLERCKRTLSMWEKQLATSKKEKRRVDADVKLYQAHVTAAKLTLEQAEEWAHEDRARKPIATESATTAAGAE